MGLKVELLADADLRSQILTLVREQVRPLVFEHLKDHVIEFVQKAQQHDSINSIVFKAVKELIWGPSNSWSVPDHVTAFRKQVLEAITKAAVDTMGAWKADMAAQVTREVKSNIATESKMRELIREEIRAVMKGL